jgi:hypothetical protein
MELLHFLTSQAKKVFATLVFIRMVPVIKRFYDHGVTDGCLPVRCKFQGSKWVYDHPDADLLAEVFLMRDEI